MNRIKYRLIGIIAVFALTHSCTQIEDVVLPPYKPQIVVNGLISDQEPTLVKLSQSISSLDTNVIPIITRASVQLYDESGALFDNLSYNGFDGGFVGTKTVQKGQRYRLRVNYESKELNATTELTSGAFIRDIFYNDSTGLDTAGFNLGEVSFSFTDIQGQDNFYRVNVFYYDIVRQSFEVLDLRTDEFINARATRTDDGYIFSDETFRGDEITIRAEVPFGFVDNSAPFKFYIKLEALNRDLSLYEESRELYRQSRESLFSEPVDLYSNIQGGLGIFGGASLDQDTLF